ncbi:MAG TPA: hypothetical protein VLA47_06800 [Nitrospira sp.]|nr:hypothetical protein [Nitrospira sp.]
MTHHDDKNLDILERALMDGYRSRSKVPHDVNVTQEVMRDVRQSAGERQQWAAATVLDQLVWRTATITAAVVLVATMVTVGLLRPPAEKNPVLVAEELESVPLFGE